MIKTYEQQVDEFAEWFLQHDKFLEGVTKEILKQSFFENGCPLILGARCSKFRPKFTHTVYKVCTKCIYSKYGKFCSVNPFTRFWAQCLGWLNDVRWLQK